MRNSSNQSCSQSDAQLQQRPDPEHIAAQVEEITALSLIYPDEFRLVSTCRISTTKQERASADSNGDDLLLADDDDDYHYEAYAHPIRYQVNLMVDVDDVDDADGHDSVNSRVCSRNIDDGPNNGKVSSPGCSSNTSTQNGAQQQQQQQLSSTPTTVVLHVEYPIQYPDVPPLFSLEMTTNCDEKEGDRCRDQHDKIILQAIQDAIEEGVPCVLQCVQAGREKWHELQQQQQQRLEREEQQQQLLLQQQQSKDDAHLMFFDSLPRPILNTILDHYCNVQDRCRLAVASRFVWTLQEHRAQRILATTCDNHDQNHNYWVSALGGRGWTVDGIGKESWELDVRHAQEQFQILSFHQQLWRRERCVTFDFGDNSNSTEPEPRHHWRIREGVQQRRQLATTTAHGDVASNNSNDSNNNRFWILNQSSAMGNCAYFSVTTSTTFSHRMHSSEHAWYLVRVLFRALHPNDGDIFVGIVHDAYDRMPDACIGSRHVLGGGFGVETEQFAFVNVISGQNRPAGILMEVNVGLMVHGSTIEYGIPIDRYYGRPEFNRGKVSSTIRSGRSTELANDPEDVVRIAVVLAASSEQREMRASVAFQQCLEKEWKEKMVIPYNHL